MADAVEDLLREYPDTPILDLSEVRFLDGSVISVIVDAVRRLDARGARLRVSADGQPLRLLELTGLSAQMSVHRRNRPRIAVA